MPVTWKAGVMVTEHGVLLVARFHRVRVTHPDGTDERFDYSPGSRNYAQEAWRKKGLEVSFGEFQGWTAQVSQQVERGWQAAWCDSAGVQDLEVDLGSQIGGVPVQAIVTLLDRYAAEGWRVVHVSEDRGLYAGADVAEESFITRIRYLFAQS
jgi:hypothetical protein